MATRLLLFCFLLPAVFSAKVNAMYWGGKIEYRFKTADSIEILFTKYTECFSAGDYLPQKLYIGTGKDTFTDYLPMCNYYASTDLCDDSLSTCFGGEIHTSVIFEYKKVIYIKPFNACKLYFFWQGENVDGDYARRNASITTGFAEKVPYVYAMVDYCHVKASHSPLFENKFPDFIEHAKDYYYDYGIAVEHPEDDSIYVEFIAPLTKNGAVLNYAGAFGVTRPLTFLGFPNPAPSLPAGFHFDNNCGELRFRPMTANQIASMNVKVSHFIKRNGNVYKVAEVMYEHTICPVPGNRFGTLYFRPIILFNPDCIQKSSFPGITCGTNKPPLPPLVTICTHDSAFLSIGDDSDYTYQWQKDSIPIPGAVSASFWAKDTGYYRVVVKHKQTICSKTSRTTRVQFFDGEKPQISDSNLRYCIGDTAAIWRQNKNYPWMLWKKNGQPFSDDTALVFPVAQPAIYTLDVINDKGCRVSSNSIDIKFGIPDNTLFDERLKKHCGNFTDTLRANRALSFYNWNMHHFDPELLITVPGTYVLSAIDTNNCPAKDSVTILQFNPLVSVGNDTSICFNAPVNLTLLAIPLPAGPHKYTWNNNPLDTLPQKTATSTGLYFVQVTDTNNCKASDSITITRHPEIKINLGRDTIICNSNNYTINISQPFYKYQWSTADTSSAINVVADGKYWAQVTDTNQCTTGDTIFVSFKYTPQIAIEDTVLCERDFITFEVPAQYDRYLWSTGSKNNFIDIREPGPVWVRVFNSCGEDRDSAIVTDCNYPPPVIFIPNAFTPNDDGFNNIFKITAENVRKINIKIFSRWGQLVFETNDINEGWDGMYEYKPVSDETFMYILSVEGLDKSFNIYYGNINVIR